ncbi:hypothetical protein CDL15_Pgr026808 [Punica granatum]|uniref:Uncharacterized protein n=1 Tax=Punica granatum TaxID=22663 RepID=A0A218WLJ8_PUNGR|nr:hypothetical protein CDL15_Pgr026808 [Punica granatum]
MGYLFEGLKTEELGSVRNRKLDLLNSLANLEVFVRKLKDIKLVTKLRDKHGFQGFVAIDPNGISHRTVKPLKKGIVAVNLEYHT